MFLKIFNFFKRKKKELSVVVNHDDVFKQLMQEHADHEYEKNAKAEGIDMFEQYLNGQVILIARPRQCFHLIYTTSKWETGDYDKIRQAEFQRLKSEYNGK